MGLIRRLSKACKGVAGFRMNTLLSENYKESNCGFQSVSP
jgi:hypothetical protein